jgi:hypothetical protein
MTAPLDTTTQLTQLLEQSRARLRTFDSLFDWYRALSTRVLRAQLRLEIVDHEHEVGELELEIADFLRVVKALTWEYRTSASSSERRAA